jgi:hypothetical protein
MAVVWGDPNFPNVSAMGKNKIARLQAATGQAISSLFGDVNVASLRLSSPVKVVATNNSYARCNV